MPRSSQNRVDVAAADGSADSRRRVRSPIRLRRVFERIAAPLRTLAGFSRLCAACSRTFADGGVCPACLRQSTGANGPWQTASVPMPSTRARIHVVYFARYDAPDDGGRGRIADLLTLFKYGGRRDAGRALAAAFAAAPAVLRNRFDAVVPIPLSAAKLRSRGFNQASWLARTLARSLDCPVRADVLHRPLDSDEAQAGRSAAARRRNRVNPFSARAVPSGFENLLLVDDVCTTGSTLGYAASALLCAGALRVEAAVLLIALPKARNERTRSRKMGL